MEGWKLKPGSASLAAGRHLRQQDRPPSLPVPPLKQTCEIYLSILETVVEPDQLRRTRELLEVFQRPGGLGERLQKGLEKKASSTDNWLTDDYVRVDYLDSRKPVVIFSNVGMVFAPSAYRDTAKDQIRAAAKTTVAALMTKAKIDGMSPVASLGGKPLCRTMFEQLISSCRIPGPKTDSLEFYSRRSSASQHITVVHRNQFFMVEVYHSDGTPLTVDQLCVQLDRIYSSSETRVEPVGLLTSQRRDAWNKAYISLIQDDTNRESVAAIESSIFTLCLDGAMPPVDEDQNHITPILQMMHGGGSRWNSGNRWFDKGLQIIAAEDGTCGINGCHAVADGLTALFFMDLTLENMLCLCGRFMVTKLLSGPPPGGGNRKKLQVMDSPLEPLPLPKKLHFNITPEIQKDIEEAKQHLDTLVQGLVVTVTRFNHFGKDTLKALKTSPDSFIQLAIQLAYYRLHQCCCPTVEPITLSMFSRGRLGFINSNTKASGAFVKAFDDPNKQSSEKVRLLEEAVKAHKWFIQMGLSGQVTEAHLFGLKMQAAEQNIPVPEIFTDPSYTKAFDFQVFTSQVTSKTGCVPCNGPEGANMLSVVYGVQKDHIHFTVSRWEQSRTSAESSVYQMFQALQDALLEMKMLLDTKTLQDTKKLQDQTPKAKL